jgi:hypothetical protein
MKTKLAQFSNRRERKEHNTAKPQPAILACGGKRSATPFWKLCAQPKSGVAAALCHRSPKSSLRSLRSLRLSK